MVQRRRTRKTGTSSACTRETRAFTAPSGSRWTHWTQLGIPYDDTPGVSSFCGAAAAAWCGIHSAGREPDASSSRAWRGARRCRRREGIAALGRPRRLDGDVSFRRNAGRPAGRSAAGRVHARHPGGAGIQGHLARGKGGALPSGRAGTGGARKQISQKRRWCWWGISSRADYERSKLYDPSFATEFREATAVTVRLLAFTQKGMELARRLAAELSGEAARCGEGCTLDAWTADAFANADALVYVGAAGIAVRAVAPYAGNKASDPAVVAVDECGRFAVPLLSGHLGGANRFGPAHRRCLRRAARHHHGHGRKRRVRRGRVGQCGRAAACWMNAGAHQTGVGKATGGRNGSVLRSQWPIARHAPRRALSWRDGGSVQIFELTVHSADADALRLVPQNRGAGRGLPEGHWRSRRWSEAFAALLAAKRAVRRGIVIRCAAST